MALRTNRNFRRLFLGRVTTNAGDSLYLIVTMWLVHDLTGSTLYTGLAAFLLTAPNALGFLFGPLADRWPSKPVLVWSQALQAVVLASITVAWTLGYRHVWLLLAVIPALALVNQLVYPTLNAVLPRIVEQDDLMGANSAFAVAFQGLDTTFNAIAGVLIAVVGAMTLYALDIVTFLVALGLYATVVIPDTHREPSTSSETASVDRTEPSPGDGEMVAAPDGGDAPENPGDPDSGRDGVPEPAAAETTDDRIPDPGAGDSYIDELLEGLAVFRDTALWKLSAAVFLGILSYWLAFAALPAFAAARGGPAMYGLLLAGLAAGTLVGFLLAPRLRAYAFGQVIIVLSVVGGIAWFLALVVDVRPVTLALVAVATVVIGVFTVSAQTLFQTAVPEHLLGRTVAFQVTVAGVAAPMGAAMGGIIGDAVGVQIAVALFGVGNLAVATIFLADHDLRSLPAMDAIGPMDVGFPAK